MSPAADLPGHRRGALLIPGGSRETSQLYVCRYGRSRLRRCAASGCDRWLVDTSRNQSRRYCEHACASRTTVAAYRARLKAATRVSR